MDRIKIQLSPEDLGRVDIKLDMQKDGMVKAVIAADKPETLQWLQQDAKHLERALQDAGFKLDNGSLSFNLRQDNNSAQQFSAFQDQHNAKDSNHGRQVYQQPQTVSNDDNDHSVVSYRLAGNNGLDIRV